MMGNRPTHRPHARNSCGMCKPGKREGQDRIPARTLSLADFRRLVDEGQDLARSFKLATAGAHAITADDLAQVSR